MTYHGIAVKAGVEPDSIERFMRKEKPQDIRLATAEKIACVLRLELRDRDS